MLHALSRIRFAFTTYVTLETQPIHAR
jgi:hypothetical protein